MPRSALVAGACVLVVTPLALGAVPLPWPGPPASGGGGNSTSNGTDPNAYNLSLGAQWSAWSAKPGSLGAVPAAYGFDVVSPTVAMPTGDGPTGDVRSKKIFLNVARNADSSTAVPNNMHLQADNNGENFYPHPSLPADSGPTYGAQLADGSLLGNSFAPAATNNPKGLVTWSSTDNGKSWSHWNAPITEGKLALTYYRTAANPIQLADGTILQQTYGGGTDNGTTGSFSVTLQSTDGGKTWSQRSLLNTDGDSSESAIVQTSDGRLLSISRQNEGSNKPTLPLRQQFSADQGKTWSAPGIFKPPAGMASEGIMPSLALQPNGVLMLSTGRPDNQVFLSWDGTGGTWDTGAVTYSNYIRNTAIGRWMGSSGNTSLVPGESNYSLQLGDICHNIWSCQEYGQQTGVWTQRVDAVTPGVGKIDLAAGVLAGTVKLSGTVLAADSRFPQQRLAGAVDGSNQYRAATRFTGKGATATSGLTIDLGREYSLNKIGLMLDRGVQNSANVITSTDGVHWGKPVVRQQKSTDFAVRYHALKRPVEARYIRVLKGAGAPLTAVNEIELYASDMWTFENDAVNVTPRGLTDTLHAFTADTIMPGADSSRRMILVDTDPDTRAHATFPIADARGVHLSFDFAGEGYGSGAIWTLAGKDKNGKDGTAWQFLLTPDGAHNQFILKVWDGTAWQQAATFPTFTANYLWIPVTIDASATSATVTLHGASVTTTAPLAVVKKFDAFTPSTGLNVADTNMEHSYDNVQIDPLK